MKTGSLLDETGWRLLEHLQEDARLSYNELGRRVHLSSPAVAERVRRMEEAGIISGYHAAVDPAKVGAPITAMVRMTTSGADRTRLADVVRDLPEVLECHRLTGTDCFSMKAVLASMGHLERLIDRLAPYGEPVTSLVLSSPVSRRAVVDVTGGALDQDGQPGVRSQVHDAPRKGRG